MKFNQPLFCMLCLEQLTVSSMRIREPNVLKKTERLYMEAHKVVGCRMCGMNMRLNNETLQ